MGLVIHVYEKQALKHDNDVTHCSIRTLFYRMYRY